ncbi:MAG: histidine ammonia-lyase [Alphaproteobacteria bacterium]|jgi:histidine ammonia-lyase|nr:histidine ammonia-lyase [Alphaproteobacteria bacterium]MDP6815791.1 histidine ammonia-lyase [Alphaproteobacteria bacterium]
MAKGREAPLALQPGALALADLRRLAGAGKPLDIVFAEGCRAAVEAAEAAVREVLDSGRTVYGVNTGFGNLAQVGIPADQLATLQRNIVLSHAAGTGPLLDDPTVRLILVLKAAALARGYSGVRWETIEALLRLSKADVLPCLPAKGSVGASGDLAPLAHLSAALLGVGEVRHKGKPLPAAEGLRKADLEPLELGPKEGLALLNGTQVSTAMALRGLFAAERLLAAALVVGALSVDAAMGSDVPFDDRIHAVRGQPGQRRVAAIQRRLLTGSAIRHSHLSCDRVQDPYCLRCQPQVMGACLDHLEFAAGVLEREANAVSDNPLVFAEDGEILSGGNFHAEPVAMAADVLALVLAETGALAERRVALLVDEKFSGLPPFLAKDSGLNSGFMVAHVTAAALASENKGLAHPASVDSLPTSANQEDHVSMAAHAARRLGEMADNTAGILAIEWLAAAQGVEFHAPMSSSDELMAAVALLRKVVPPLETDRFLAPDIAAAKALIVDGALDRFGGELLPTA